MAMCIENLYMYPRCIQMLMHATGLALALARTMATCAAPAARFMVALLLSAAKAANMVVDITQLLMDQQQFHDRVSESRWVAHTMDYVDGVTSAVCKPVDILLVCFRAQFS
eukprot:3527029-Pleurochrysis_carterae.AAC.5